MFAAFIGVMLLVRLTRKLADKIDGVDISAYRVGEIIALPLRAARLLMAEGWAEMVERRSYPRETIYGVLRTS